LRTPRTDKQTPATTKTGGTLLLTPNFVIGGMDDDAAAAMTMPTRAEKRCQKQSQTEARRDMDAVIGSVLEARGSPGQWF
jgi:hypothetical protein